MCKSINYFYVSRVHLPHPADLNHVPLLPAKGLHRTLSVINVLALEEPSTNPEGKVKPKLGEHGRCFCVVLPFESF